MVMSIVLRIGLLFSSLLQLLYNDKYVPPRDIPLTFSRKAATPIIVFKVKVMTWWATIFVYKT